MRGRALKELELLSVAGLYGMVDARAPAPVVAPAPSVPATARAAPVAEPAPVVPRVTAPPPPPPIEFAAEAAPRVASPATAPVVVAPPANVSGLDWKGLRELVRDCTRCELCQGRKQAVFGVGSETGPWLFVGEGPGADEDEQGEPFVGQAGKLLDNMLTAAGLKRGRDVYIANVVKCRPPGNRTPKPEEAAACAAYLDRQIELIQPKLIVALGKTAAVRLLGDTAEHSSMASLRGRKLAYKGTPVVVTYHPAYLLRSLPEKSKAWEDLLFAKRTFGTA